MARGGLRWSDRREDFRTEILGLVKAQAVKNAVIVPVGAKGGFVVKRPPAATGDPGLDRQATLAEGIACYRMFISGLLDLTDNLEAGHTVPAPQVVRYDGDNSYVDRRLQRDLAGRQLGGLHRGLQQPREVRWRADRQVLEVQADPAARRCGRVRGPVLTGRQPPWRTPPYRAALPPGLR